MERAMTNGFTKAGAKLIDLENLKDIIRSIAKGHSQEISKEAKSEVKNKREFDIFEIAREVTSQKPFNGIDQSAIDNELKTLDICIKNILESSFLVKDQGIKELVPLPYEVLSVLFTCTNEEFRKSFFHELMDYYYDKLCTNMKKLSVTTVYRKQDFDQQVKILLPVIKLEACLRFVDSEDSESQKLLEEITSNLASFFKYSRLNREDVYAVVNNKLKSKDYELLSYEMIPLDERNGHLGDYFKLKIHLEVEGTELVFNLFAKFLTPTLDIMKELLKSGPSKKEEFFYMTYQPVLKKYGLHSLLDFSPNCYFSRVDDVLILDDMTFEGFTSLTPNIKLEFDGLMYVIKQIAKLHACSMILEEFLSQEKGNRVFLPDVYQEYLKEVLFDPDGAMNDIFDSALETIHYLAKVFSELNKTLSFDELTEKINTGWKLMFEKVKRSQKFKNALCHGDMYVGNMLFKFDKNKTSCLDATLVDFQILRYCPPVQDLLFFIQQNSLKDTRDKYFGQLVDGYYSELSRHLNSYDLDIGKIYPKDEFEQSIKYMKSQAVFQSLFYSPVNTIDPRVREEMFQNPEMAEEYLLGSKIALIDLCLERDDYRKVMSELIADLIELCESGLL